MTASNVRIKNRRATPLQTQGSPHMRFLCSTSLRHSVSRGTKVCPPLTLQCLLHQRSQLTALRKRQVLDLAANLCIHPVNRLNQDHNIHADDTPVPVLAPGNGKTRTGRIWVYLRDERYHAGAVPPAVLYRYTPDRKGERCHAHLASFRGHLHADGYAGFAELYDVAGMGPPRVLEVACWAHARRKFFDVHKATGSAIAKEALDRIGALFDIERTIAGQPPGQRAGLRQSKARPKLDALAIWFNEQLTLIPGKSELAGAIRYARSRWEALMRYCNDGPP